MLLRKKLFVHQMPNTIYKKDLVLLSKLLSKGYSIIQSLEIISGYQHIIDKLMKGDDFKDYLILNSKDKFYQSLNYFINITSLDKAIISSFEYENSKKEANKQFIKEISYPLLTLLFAFIVFIFFNLFLYPQLLNFINTTNHLNNLVNIFINSLILIFILLFSLYMLYLFIQNKECFKKCYLKYIGKIFIVKDLFTYDFAFHYYLLIKQGFTTKQVFEYLLKLDKNSIFTINIQIFIDQLNKGIQFNKIIENHQYFDSKFITFFKIGCYTQTIDEVLNEYLNYQKDKLNKYLKTFSKVITISSYMFIALLIISIYQMLLIPIDMIQNF